MNYIEVSKERFDFWERTLPPDSETLSIEIFKSDNNGRMILVKDDVPEIIAYTQVNDVHAHSDIAVSVVNMKPIKFFIREDVINGVDFVRIPAEEFDKMINAMSTEKFSQLFLRTKYIKVDENVIVYWQPFMTNDVVAFSDEETDDAYIDKVLWDAIREDDEQ